MGERDDDTAVSRIDELLERERRTLRRLEPEEVPAALAAGALLIDTRPLEQRRRDGELPGAIVVDRNVLEWRLDPTNPGHLAEVADTDQPIIVVCNQGYSSSLVAASLQRLGLVNATDVVGGFEAWVARGLPVERPDQATPGSL